MVDVKGKDGLPVGNEGKEGKAGSLEGRTGRVVILGWNTDKEGGMAGVVEGKEGKLTGGKEGKEGGKAGRSVGRNGEGVVICKGEGEKRLS